MIERFKTGASFTGGLLYDGLRIVALSAVEPLARSMFPEAYPVGFDDRARIVELCDKVDALAKKRNDDQAAFDAYSAARGELVGMLSAQRIRALATFHGMRDPEDVPMFAQRVVDTVQWIAGFLLEDFAKMPETIQSLVETMNVQRDALARATVAALDVVTEGTWTNDLEVVIRSVAGERDAARQERDELRAQIAALGVARAELDEQAQRVSGELNRQSLDTTSSDGD